ncbi:hypothetical protein QUF70_01895 [Desulfobacterales bacterium HSG17]|nr:hypothetical protein [Desulfobacterales bacterium HSG17]
MITLDEQDLRISLENAVNGENFDRDEIKNGTSIQPVDLIFEFEKYYLFVEVKDPDVPGASNPEHFRKDLQTGKVIRKVAGKFRDTTFFRMNQGKNDKPIKYLFLLSMASLDPILLSNKQDELRKSLPAVHHFWESDITCMVINIQQWQRLFGTDSLTRISEISS